MEVVAAGESAFELADGDSPYLIVFLPVSIAGKPNAVEHFGIGWNTPANLGRLPLAPCDRRYVEHLDLVRE